MNSPIPTHDSKKAIISYFKEESYYNNKRKIELRIEAKDLTETDKIVFGLKKLTEENNEFDKFYIKEEQKTTQKNKLIHSFGSYFVSISMFILYVIFDLIKDNQISIDSIKFYIDLISTLPIWKIVVL